MTRDAIAALILANQPAPTTFRFGSNLARLRRIGGDAALEALDIDALTNRLAEAADWRAWRGKKLVPVYPSAPVVRNVLAEPDWPLPAINRLVRSPVFDEDGRLIATSGYHPDARTFLDLDPRLQIPPVSPDPTSGEVETAKALILHLCLVDFPFVTQSDLAHSVGAMLLPFVRTMIHGPTPLHLINAPTKGTGKTLLAEAVVHPAAGTTGVSTEARTEEEWRKRIGALLAAGPAVIWVDNIKAHLDSGALAAVLTEEWWTDRLLGRNDKTIRYPNNALWIATGNGVTLSDELTRRTVPIDLDAGIEHPYLRRTSSFHIPNLRTWLHANRGLLIWACATLIQRWIQDGCPKGTETIGSYESWAETIGGILGNAGIYGLLANLGEFYASSDPESQAWSAFITLWWEQHGEQAVKSGELLPTYDSLEDDFLVLGGGPNSRLRASSLGNHLLRQRNRIFAGYKLTKVDIHQGSNRWKLQRTAGP